MTKILSFIKRAKIDQCRIGKQTGKHGSVIYGTGGMGDGCVCLRCGLDTYSDLRKDCEDWWQIRGKPDWPALKKARSLPLDDREVQY